MHTHVASTIAQLSCDTVSCLALENGRLLYAGTTDRKAQVVYGDDAGPVFDGLPVSAWGPHIAIVAGRPLYSAVRNGKELLIHGGYEGRPCDRVAGISISTDGSIAYQAKEGSDHFVVVNGVEGKRYPSVWMHGFADGKALYAVDLQRTDRTKPWKEEHDRSRQRMVFGADEGPICKAILKDRCKPIIAEGRSIYGVLNVDGSCSFIDGSRIVRQYHGLSHILPHLVEGSPLYIAIERAEPQSESQYLLMLGEKEIARHGHIDYLSWVDGAPLYIAHEAGKNFLMHGTRRFDYDCHIGPPDLIDGKPFFIGHTGGYVGDDRLREDFVVYGDVRGERFESVYSLDLIGGKPAYTVGLPSNGYDEDGERIPRSCFVHGTERGQVYSVIRDVIAAGDLPAYTAYHDEGGPCVVVGTDEGPSFEHVFSLRFDAERQEVSYGAFKDRTVYRVTVKV